MPDIKVEPKSLRAAAGHGEEMYSGMGTAIGDLSAHHQGVPGQTDGSDFAAELMKVQRAWHDRLNDVGAECGSIAVALRLTADAYEKNDTETADSFKQNSVRSAVSRSAAPSAARHDSPFG